MILLTGATGYIGSHTWVELLNYGYQVIGIDNFSNSNPGVINRIEKITSQKVNFFEGDILDNQFLHKIFNNHPISSVIHFAALKAIGESVKDPVKYYTNNLGGLLSLLNVLAAHACHQFVFSSSATVYSAANQTPYTEDMILGCTNPYGWTKYMGEQILRDAEKSSPKLKVAYLRYFNPGGAHASGLIGEDPRSIPNNLIPYISKVAIGKLDCLPVYGGDWSTHDETGVRDYIHVADIALGHLKALEYLNSRNQSLTVNLGLGRGYSVLDVISAYQKVSGKKINYQIVERRKGDIAIYFANTTLAEKLLGWSPQYDLERICLDSWRWESKNPNGFS